MQQDLFSSFSTPASQTSFTKNKGIQPGQNVFAGDARNLDANVAKVAHLVHHELRALYPNLLFKKKLTEDELKNIMPSLAWQDTAIKGCRPDGGIFLWKRGHVEIPLMALEAKHQGDKGNAEERWFKNYTTFKNIAPHMAYVTFCIGKGAIKGGLFERSLNNAYVDWAMTYERTSEIRKWNHRYDSGPSLWRRPSGFSEKQLYIICKTTLLRRIESLKWR